MKISPRQVKTMDATLNVSTSNMSLVEVSLFVLMVKSSKKRPFCSTGGFLCYPRCSEETLVKGARLAWSQSTHVHAGTSSHHYYSGQPIFWSYLLWMSKEEDQMYAARGMHAFNQERVLVSLGGAGGERFLTWWSQGAEDLIFFFFIFFTFGPCSAIALRHSRQQSVCNIWDSIPWPTGSGICGRVQSLQFLSRCCQIIHGPFILCQCIGPISTREGQKGKSLDCTVSLSLNLNFWCT